MFERRGLLLLLVRILPRFNFNSSHLTNPFSGMVKVRGLLFIVGTSAPQGADEEDLTDLVALARGHVGFNKRESKVDQYSANWGNIMRPSPEPLKKTKKTWVPADEPVTRAHQQSRA